MTNRRRRHGYGSQTSSSGGGARKQDQCTTKHLRRLEEWVDGFDAVDVRWLSASSAARRSADDARLLWHTSPTSRIVDGQIRRRTTVGNEDVVDCGHRTRGRPTGRRYRRVVVWHGAAVDEYILYDLIGRLWSGRPISFSLVELARRSRSMV